MTLDALYFGERHEQSEPTSIAFCEAPLKSSQEIISVFRAAPFRLMLQELWRSGAPEAIIGIALSALLGFGTQLWIARTTSADAFGEYVVILSVVNVLQIVTTLDFGSAHLRYLSRYLEVGERARAKGMVRLGRAVPFVLTTAGWLLYRSVGDPLRPKEVPSVVLYALLLLSGLGRVDTSLGVAIGQRRLSTISNQVIRPLLTLSVLVYFAGTAMAGSTLAPIVALIIGLAGAQCLNTWISRSIVLEDVQPDYADTPIWVKHASAMMLASLASVVVASQSDAILVALLANKADAGVYAVANQLASLIALSGGALAAFWTPRLSTLFDSLRMPQALADGRRLERLLAGISVVGAALTVPLAPSLLRLYGKQFQGGVGILTILCVAHGITVSLSCVPSIFLSLAGRQKQVILLISTSGAIGVVVALVASPHFGSPGIAMGTLTGMIARTILLRTAWRRSRRS